MPDVVEVNVETGETIERAYTPDEAAQLEADRRAYYEGRLEADRTELVADGVDSVTVSTWRFSDPGPVAFSVNGQAVDVALVEGRADLKITTATPGPIEVTVGDQSLILTATVPQEV